MARISRDHPPTGSGPGRGTPRSRTTSRPAERAATRAHGRVVPPERIVQSDAESAASTRRLPRITRSLGLTRRALVFLGVAAILMLSYVSSLKVYFNQQRAIADTQASIAAHQQAIASLQDQVRRWQDPEYVKAQARSQLGWVLPGETGYKVITADGTVLGPSVTLNNPSESGASASVEDQWWSKLAGSIETADKPAAAGASAKPKAESTVIGPASASPAASKKPTASSSGSGR